MTTRTEVTPLEAIRGLHVLYGIAIQKAYAEGGMSTVRTVYDGIANELHLSMRGIANGSDPQTEIRRLVTIWTDKLSWSKSAAVYSSWAENVKEIIG